MTVRRFGPLYISDVWRVTLYLTVENKILMLDQSLKT